MDIGTEKDIPVMGVNSVLQKSQICRMIENDDVFLNSLKETDVGSSSFWMRESDQFSDHSSQHANSDSDTYDVMKIDIGEPQELQPT